MCYIGECVSIWDALMIKWLRTADLVLLGVVYVSKMPFSHGRWLISCCNRGGSGKYLLGISLAEFLTFFFFLF